MCEHACIHTATYPPTHMYMCLLAGTLTHRLLLGEEKIIKFLSYPSFYNILSPFTIFWIKTSSKLL